MSVLSDKDNSSFFIRYVASDKPISPETIARFVVETLEKSGMKTTIFKGHSLRSASTSSPGCTLFNRNS